MSIDAETQTVESGPQIPAQETAAQEDPAPAAEEKEKPPPPPPGGYPFYRAYIHLILPIALCIFNSLATNFILLIPLAFLTYFIGSFIYPNHRLPPPEWSPEARRFSEKWWPYPVAIVQVYGYIWNLPSPLSLSNLVQNVGITYVGLNYFGLLNNGDFRPSSRLWGSAFLMPALRAVAYDCLLYLLLRYIPIIGNFWLIRWASGALWRVAVIALVDDVIGGLAYPDVRTKKGKAKVITLQFFVFCYVSYWRREMETRMAILKTIAGFLGMSVKEMLKSEKSAEELIESARLEWTRQAAAKAVSRALPKDLGPGSWFGGEEDVGGLFEELDLFDKE